MLWRKAPKNDGRESGLTVRSLAAMLFCIVLASFYTNYSCAFLNEHYQIVNQAIPVPAILAILFSALMVGAAGLLARRQLLTRAELVCVAFATMMAAPLMSDGFWQRVFGLAASVPRAGAFDYIDVYDDGLWPHGRNVLDGAFDEPKSSSFTNITWSVVEYEEGVEARCPTISNATASDEAWIEFEMPVDPGNRDCIVPSHPHLVSVLAYIEGGESESELFFRAYADENPLPKTLLTGRTAPKKTLLHRKGFVRIGAYGVIPATSCSSNLVVQLGYRGRGRVTLADPKFFSVWTLESCFRGRKMIDEADWQALAPESRPAGVVVKPRNMWSARGLGYILAGGIPLRDWARPALVWTSLVLLLLAASFCVNVIMRRQWAESERYPMPNSRIPLAFVGGGGDGDSSWRPAWRNRHVWIGLALGLAYGLLKGWHCYNPRIPDLGVDIAINDYISNRAFGNMFYTHFIFRLTVCSIAVFFELNVLLSMVVGYWICRSTYCFGHLAGLDMSSGFPWREQSAVGSYLGYFVVVIAFSAKYIWAVAKDAIRGRGGEDEALSPRVAVLSLLLAHVAAAVWAHFAGIPALPAMAFFAFLVLLAFVSAKFRAECGTPYSFFTPAGSLVLVMAVGGFSTFGEKGVFMTILLSTCFTATSFYLIPGMQFELVETGRRMRIKPRHIVLTCLIGVLGGLIIGGWSFLSHGYAAGSDNLRGSLLYSGFGWFSNSFRGPLASATNDWLNAGSSPLASSPWEMRSLMLGGSVTAVLAVLRHYISGFWFHPIGFILGWTNMDNGAPWGTLLVAWLIRFATLKIAGARAVRDKLLPFFTGVFAGCVISLAVFTILNSLAYLSGSPDFAGFIP